ncbi:hypothetical protein [Streptomyces sp. NBC_01435]|uniref:hypothetical protein n=1 Tax=Streptomyces sp. NBC_01435 TaxID=2903865 RepID=UPI002E3817CE|nr:hypothetical protein [Streptomyces sp. NBC_01435]
MSAIAEILAATTNESTGTRGRLRRRVEALLAERHGLGMVAMPSKSAFYRLVEAISEGTHAFGEATSRRSAARRPQGAFTPVFAGRGRGGAALSVKRWRAAGAGTLALGSQEGWT